MYNLLFGMRESEVGVNIQGIINYSVSKLPFFFLLLFKREVEANAGTVLLIKKKQRN